jgi:NitT/TauT family transport system substrate-binding protein
MSTNVRKVDSAPKLKTSARPKADIGRYWRRKIIGRIWLQIRQLNSGTSKTMLQHQWARGPSVLTRGVAICSGRFWSRALVFFAWVVMSHPSHAQSTTIRVGYFPNATHVHALVAQNLQRHGRDWFAERLGPEVQVEWQPYNAGPSAMRAMASKSIDLTYAGPYPVIDAYTRSRGNDVRIVAGAVTGGSALVVQPNSKRSTPADFRGSRIAVPEFENTQALAARAWLAAGGVRVSSTGNDVELLPTPNSEQLALFQFLQVDAVWTVEPWVARLELLADGKILVEDSNEITTMLVSSAQFLTSQPDLARRFVAAHRELTDWIGNNPAAAQRMITEELLLRFKTNMNNVVLARGWQRIKLTNDVSLDSLQDIVERAKLAGYLRSTPDLSRLLQIP